MNLRPPVAQRQPKDDNRNPVPGTTLRVNIEKARKWTKPRKIKRQMTPAQMDDLTQNVMIKDGRCFYVDFSDEQCDGPTTSDHIITQDWIRRHFTGEQRRQLLRNPDVAVAACRRHHDLKTAGLLYVEYEDLPQRVQDAITAYGYEATLLDAKARRHQHRNGTP